VDVDEAINVALLRPADQSSTFASGRAALAVDGSLETCSTTLEAEADPQRWWSVELARAVNIKEVAVTVNHGIAFNQEFTVFIIARSGDSRTKFHKCASFAGILRAGQRHRLPCPPDGIVGEKVYIRDDRREGSLALCEVEVQANSGGMCRQPPAIANGRVVVLGGTQQQIRFECNPGYLLWGSSDLACLANNTWSSEMPVCNPMTCGYPYVEDAKAVIQKSSYNIKASQGADINDKAIVVCSKGHHMLVNTSASTIAIRDHVQIVCSHDGVWEKDYPYKCLDQAALAQMMPLLNLTSTASEAGGKSSHPPLLDSEAGVIEATDKTNEISVHSIVFTLVSVVLFLVLCLLLTCLLRHRRLRALKRRAEAAVTWPRNVQIDSPPSKTSSTSSIRPLISVFTTHTSADNAKKTSFGSSSTASLVNNQHHSGSSVKLIPTEDTTATIHVAGRYNSNTKKISYEDDFHLPDSGSLVQGVSVDPHSAVFGRNGQRLDDKPEAADLLQPNGLPDVTGYYHKNSNGGTFLSSFQPNPSRLHGDEEPQRPLWPGGALPPPPPPPGRPQPEERTSLLPVASSSPLENEKHAEKFTPGELPELDEAGYASLILRTAKTNKDEPVYEHIKGERPLSQELMSPSTTTSKNAITAFIAVPSVQAPVLPASAGLETVSDSGESHAYYSRVALSLEMQPPPLKEHLYQNFDQVFLAMEKERQLQEPHPDLLKTAEIGNNDNSNEQFYENTRSLSPNAKEVVVNDEKLLNMYAQVDVVKKHFDRNNKAYQSLQVIDSNVPASQNTKQDLLKPTLVSREATTEAVVEAGNNGIITTAWEEEI